MNLIFMPKDTQVELRKARNTFWDCPTLESLNTLINLVYAKGKEDAEREKDATHA